MTDISLDPFLCLHLRCPTGSYDVNVEPAKDEVLFIDTTGIRKLLKAFLVSVYGDLPDNSEDAVLRDDSHGRTLSVPKSQPFELLLAKGERPLSKTTKNVLQLDQSPDLMCRTSAKQQEHDPERRSSIQEPLPDSYYDKDHPSTSKHQLNASPKSYRNMYDFEEDDLSRSELPSSAEQDSVAELDRAELRKASVTNPWAIAKLNALIPSIQSPSSKVDSRHATEQLMTPGPDSGAINPISSRTRPAFVSKANLPSPARSDSSRSPPYRPNPGPPLRRSALLEHVEDDIEFTQDSTKDDSTPSCSTSLESSANRKTHRRQLPLPNQASESVDMDGRFESPVNQTTIYLGDAQTEKQPVQSTISGEERVEMLQTYNAGSKPFIPPVKSARRSLTLHPPLKLTPTVSSQSIKQSTLELPWESSESETRSITPASYAAAPRLSQSYQNPMASPPLLRPSPPQISTSLKKMGSASQPDLEEIMDFEHRKKAVNAQHKIQSKLNNRYLNPGQLARIQRESMPSSQAREVSHPLGNSSQTLPVPSFSARNSTQKVYDEVRSIDSRFSDLPSVPSQEEGGPFTKSSPHRSRYLAARVVLTRPESPRQSPGLRPGVALQSTDENSESAGTLPSFPEEDPRAYLIQHRNASSCDPQGRDANPQSGHPRPGLKIKRTKTSKLPLETIPPSLATYNICAKLTSSTALPNDFKAKFRHLTATDPYPRTGKNDFVVWNANSGEVNRWEEEVKRLIRKKYVAKLPDGEEIPANLQLSFAVAFRAHEEHCSQLG